MSRTVLTGLRRHRRWQPDQVAVRAGSHTTSWAALYDDVVAVAAGAGRVSSPGPVAVLVDQSARSLATVLGLSLAGVDVLLLEADNSYLADWRRPAEVTVVVGPRRPPAPLPGLRYLEYAECRATGGDEPRQARIPGEVLQLTSGSTGEPRIARQTMDNVLRGGRIYQEVFGLTDRDVILAAVPLAHSFGFVGGFAAALESGAELRTQPRFSVRRVLDHITSGATVLLGTPLLYRLLLPGLRRRAGVSLHTAISSGGPITADLDAAATERLGVPVRQVYGCTEAGIIACHATSGRSSEPGSVGPPGPRVRTRLEPSPDLDAGGRLLVHTSTLFRGYLDGGPSGLTADGFYDTGDLARFDADGGLCLVGRKGTFVNVGGRKVNPDRIERIIAEHPGVREVVVYGLATDDGEERLEAAVVLGSGTARQDVLAHCRLRRLMPYEVPHRVHVLDALPRTAMGKVDRRRAVAVTAELYPNHTKRED